MMRKLGIFICLLGLVGVGAAALFSTSNQQGFAGLPGIETKLTDRAEIVVAADAAGSSISADGRNLRVELPNVVDADFDRAGLESRLNEIDGVRNIELVGDPQFPVDASDAPEPRPTAAPGLIPADEPTAEPQDAPTAEPVPEPSWSEIVAGLDVGSVEFEPGSAELTAADQVVLDGVVGELAGRDGEPTEVQVHTDNVGDPDVNLLLSQQRAESVASYLNDGGVTTELTPRGFGASQPIADNSTEQGRSDNRRVVFVVEGN